MRPIPEGPQLLDTLTKEEIESVTKIIVSVSVKFAERFPFLTIDDAIQECWKELTRYQSYYKRELSALTTWVYKLASDTLTTYAQKEFNKTQKWEDIEQHVFEDEHVTTAAADCAYNDLLTTMQGIVSPCAFKLLLYLEKTPTAHLAELSKNLGLSQRNLLYLREELRIAYGYVSGNKRE